jgi:hypothetical protein
VEGLGLTARMTAASATQVIGLFKGARYSDRIRLVGLPGAQAAEECNATEIRGLGSMPAIRCN